MSDWIQLSHSIFYLTATCNFIPVYYGVVHDLISYMRHCLDNTIFRISMHCPFKAMYRLTKINDDVKFFISAHTSDVNLKKIIFQTMTFRDLESNFPLFYNLQTRFFTVSWYLVCIWSL